MNKFLSFALVSLISLSAFAAPNPTPTLTVLIEGAGSISSVPAGIDCPGQCTATFPRGTNISLTAMPDTDQTFSGWGDACAGTDPICVLKLNSDRTVTATFSGDETLSGLVAIDGNGDVIGWVVGGAGSLGSGSAWKGQQDVQILTKEGYDVVVPRSDLNRSLPFPSFNTFFYYPDSQCIGIPIGNDFYPGVVHYVGARYKLFYSPKDSVITTYTNVYQSNASSYCNAYSGSITGFPIYSNNPDITGVPNEGYTSPIRIEHR